MAACVVDTGRAMEFVNSLGGTLTGHRQPHSSSLNVVADSTGSQSDSGPSRVNASGGRSAHDVNHNLLDIFKSTLGEADSYLALYESRVKLEEDYVRGLKAMTEKSKNAIVQLDARIAASMSLDPGGADLPKARLAWKEVSENHLREIDARLHYIEALRQSVIVPLTVYRDAQERIRRRVKDDLKTSIAAYDEMRQSTLPRAKKVYDKRCEEVEQLRLQQVAIEDQKQLLSQAGMHREGSQSSHAGGATEDRTLSPTSSAPSETDEDHLRSDAETNVTSPHRSPSMRHAQKQSKHLRKPSSEGGEVSGRISSSSGVSPRVGGEASLSTSPQSAEKKGHFLDALRSRETWETARKEGPKKLNAFLNRMREGTGAGERNDQSGLSLSPDSATAGSQGLGVSLSGGSGSLKSNQNLALKNVKAKREAEEADKAYRKAVFDLETMRMRRHKTIMAAKSSVLEARRELYLTCQAVWLQAERSVQTFANAQLSFSLHAEDILRGSLDHLDTEIKKLDQRIPSVEAERVPYINFYFGECKDLIFGVSLTDYAFSRAQQAPPHLGPPKAEAPIIVQKCIRFVEERALDQPGIYRTSAKHTAIQNLAHALERDEERFQFDATNDDPSTVAGVLKLYLRQLPEPVLPMPWEERVKYTHERQEQIQTGFASLKGRIRRLPAINQATLRTIVGHLAKVAAHAEQNKMTASNLSIIFGPLLLSQADHEATSIAAAMEEDRVTEDLILYADVIFDLSHAGAPVLPFIPPPPEPAWNLDQMQTQQEQKQRRSSSQYHQGLQLASSAVAQDTTSLDPPLSTNSIETIVPSTEPLAAHLPQGNNPSSPIASSSETPLVSASSSGIQRSNAIAGHHADGVRADVHSIAKPSLSAVPETAAGAYLPPSTATPDLLHVGVDAARRGDHSANQQEEGSSTATSAPKTGPAQGGATSNALSALDVTENAQAPSADPSRAHSRSSSSAHLATPVDGIDTPMTAVSSANASLGHNRD